MVYFNKNSDSPFHDRGVEKIVSKVAKEFKLPIGDVRKILRCYFFTIRETIGNWNFENEDGTLNPDTSMYIRIPHLFSLRTSKYKIAYTKKHLENDKKSV